MEIECTKCGHINGRIVFYEHGVTLFIGVKTNEPKYLKGESQDDYYSWHMILRDGVGTCFTVCTLKSIPHMVKFANEGKING